VRRATSRGRLRGLRGDSIAERRHDSAFTATLTGLLDQLSAARVALPDDLRLDGETIFVTGASRGLGLALVTELAAHGARVVMLCRSRVADAPAEVRQTVPGADLVVKSVDLTEPLRVEAMLDELRDEGVVFDRVILNAGMVPAWSRTTRSGLDVMVHVNFVANAQLATGLRRRGEARPCGDPRVRPQGPDARTCPVPPRHGPLVAPRDALARGQFHNLLDRHPLPVARVR